MFDNFKIPKDSEAVRTRKNVMTRQKLKKKWDKHCKWATEGEMGLSGTSFAIDKFSEEEDNFVRLLDEGVVVEGDGSPYAVIAKGTLKEWYDNLPKKFSGYINKDHISGLDLGKFSKDSLRLVEIGNDRYGIDVNVKLDHELYATKDLLHQMNRKALSAEFYYEADEYIKASVVTGDDRYPDWWLIPKINAVSIIGYAVVDNPKNANSYDENLLEKASSEERNEMNKKLKAELAEDEKAKASAGAGFDPEAEAEAGIAPVEETEAETETEADAKADAGVKAEAEEAETTDTADETAADETEAEETDKVEASIEEIGKQLEAFKAEIAEKDAKIVELEAKLAAKDAQKEGFENKLAKLLNFASADEPTDTESAETTSKEENKDDYTAALENAFKEM